jgi:hypothetical protein
MECGAARPARQTYMIFDVAWVKREKTKDK